MTPQIRGPAILGRIVFHRPQDRIFVGRRDELAAFERALASARDGVPAVLLVSGEAGIGKSTFLSEAAARSDVPLYVGRCVQMGGDVIPLAPLADLLRQVGRSAPDVLGEAVGMAPLARWVRSEPGDPAGREPGSTGLFVAVLDLIIHLAAERVVAVGFEDLHWADAVTGDLFEFLARNLVDERVVLVGTYRTNDIGTTAQRRQLATLPRLPAAQRIHLEGLERQDVTTCVADLLGGSASATLVDEILARGQGNPFFTEELVAAHLAGETIPVVLSDLISADVAALDEQIRQVLGAVATVGRETSHQLLCRVAGLEAEAVESAVRAGIDAHLLVVDRDTDAYRFRHALIGEVIYADLLPPQRTRLHRRVADALGDQPAEVLARADRAGELAFHLDRAGDHDAAFVALLAAADASQEVAPAAALGHLQRAFELWDTASAAAPDERRSDRLWQAAELATGTIGNERSVELARAAFELGPPPQGEAWGHERLGRYLWSSGELDASRSEFEKAASLLPADHAADAAPVYAGLGQAELMAGRYEVAQQWCAKVLDLDAEVDPAAWVMAQRVQGVARSHLGDPDGGVELCREAREATTTAQTRALATLYLCIALLDAGRNEEAIDLALDNVARGRVAGLDRSFGGYSDALAAEGLMRLGRWSEAEELLVRHADYDTLPVGALRVARAGAMLAARRGDADRARRLLADAASQPVDGWHQTILDMGRADVHLVLRDWADASDAAERGWATNPATVVLWSARFAMASIEAGVEQALDAVASQRPIVLPEVIERLQQRLDVARDAAENDAGSAPSLDPAAHLAHAAASLTRLTTSDPDAWSAAAQRWDALGDRWWTAVATLREADAAAAAGAMDRATVALREAHRLAAAIGATPLLADIDAVSRRTRLSLDAPVRVSLDETSIDQLGLTAREAEVLTLLAAGLTNRQIGAQLFISEKTASVHVSNILRKLGVTSRVDAAAVAQRLGVA